MSKILDNARREFTFLLEDYNRMNVNEGAMSMERAEYTNRALNKLEEMENSISFKIGVGKLYQAKFNMELPTTGCSTDLITKNEVIEVIETFDDYVVIDDIYNNYRLGIDQFKASFKPRDNRDE